MTTVKKRTISPSEVEANPGVSIPAEVFEAFNELLRRCYRGGSATIKQGDVELEIVKRLPDATVVKMLEAGWLDVEDAYRADGWDVRYDKPVAYAGESYEPYWVFKKAKQ